MQLEFRDVMFFVRSLKGPTDAFNIHNHIAFHSSSTHSSAHLKLKHDLSKPNYITVQVTSTLTESRNSLPIIDLEQSVSSGFGSSSGILFYSVSNLTVHVHFTSCNNCCYGFSPLALNFKIFGDQNSAFTVIIIIVV